MSTCINQDFRYNNQRCERAGSSVVEQGPFKPRVVGSSPTRPTKNAGSLIFAQFSGAEN